MSEKPEEQNKLNIRQLKFIDGLLEGKTQKKAYIEAGYETKDDQTAEVNASRLIRNANVQEEITNRLDDLKARNRLRLHRISEAALARLVSILQTDEDIDLDKSNRKNTYLIGIKANIIKDILDRVGLKLAEEHNVNLKGKLETDLSEEKRNELISLAAEAINRSMSTSDKKKD